MTTTAPTHDDFAPKVILQVQKYRNGYWVRKTNCDTINQLLGMRNWYRYQYPTMLFRIVQITIANGQVTTEEVQ